MNKLNSYSMLSLQDRIEFINAVIDKNKKGLTYNEIAAELNTDIATVSRIIQTNKLERKLKDND